MQSPGCAGRDAGDHLHRRGLAGAIGAEEPEDLPFPDRETDAIDCYRGAIIFFQVLCIDDIRDDLTFSLRTSAGVLKNPRHLSTGTGK
jgi:hypothetical protein